MLKCVQIKLIEIQCSIIAEKRRVAGALIAFLYPQKLYAHKYPTHRVGPPEKWHISQRPTAASALFMHTIAERNPRKPYIIMNQHFFVYNLYFHCANGLPSAIIFSIRKEQAEYFYPTWSACAYDVSATSSLARLSTTSRDSIQYRCGCTCTWRSTRSVLMQNTKYHQAITPQ